MIGIRHGAVTVWLSGSSIRTCYESSALTGKSIGLGHLIELMRKLVNNHIICNRTNIPKDKLTGFKGSEITITINEQFEFINQEGGVSTIPKTDKTILIRGDKLIYKISNNEEIIQQICQPITLIEFLTSIKHLIEIC